jgi:hypothetical protein
MEHELPPPDPDESLDLTPERGPEVSGPLAVFAAGAPSGEVDRLADAILDYRPGTLIVVVR